MLATSAAERFPHRSSLIQKAVMTPSAFKSAIETLQTTAADDAAHVHWLVDQSALPPPPWLQRHLRSLEWADLLQPDERVSPDGATPLVVSCANRQQTMRFADSLFDVAQFANAVSLLVCNSPLQELRKTLAARTRIVLPENMQALLRFFDTRTLPQLPSVLSADQYALFMHGIEAWWFLDRWGDLQRMQQPSTDLQHTATLPITLDQRQEQLLVDDGLCDAVIDLLITQRHPAVTDATPPQQYELVQPLVAHAQRLGVSEPPGALAFVAKALERGADFHELEPWASGLALFTAGRCTLSEALV